MKKLLHTFAIIDTPESFFDGQYKFLSDNGYDIHLMCSFDVRAESFAKRNGIKYIPNEFTRRLSPWIDIKALIKLIKILKKEKYDAVFGHTAKDTLLLMIAAYLCRVKVRICYRHGLIYTTQKGLKRIILKLEEQFISFLATNIINVSPSLSELAVRENLNSDRKQLIIGKGTCGGIDTKKMFNPELIDRNRLAALRESLDIGTTDFVFGFCGRFCRDKGLYELVEAFNLFCSVKRNVTAKLLLVGSLDTRDNIKNDLLNEINNNKKIVTTGYVDRHVISYYYSLMNVFILPSHREGFGMVNIEAGAMEIPVLTTKAHGCVDSIEEGVTGMYIPFDSKGICDVMLKMMDSELLNRLGRNARQYVLRNYDHSVMWPLVLKTYNKIL